VMQKRVGMKIKPQDMVMSSDGRGMNRLDR